MKTRVQEAGAGYGERTNTLWEGDMPVMSGVPGMRITLLRNQEEVVGAFAIKQICFEIDADTGHSEQVIYVKPYDLTKAKVLTG